MHIETIGTGPEVVLFTGFPQPPDHFRPLCEALASDYRCRLVHQPGYGRSPAPSLPYDVAAVNQELASDLRAAGVAQAAMIGFSGGAYRAFMLGLDGGIEPRGFILLGPIVRFTETDRTALNGFADAVDAGIEIVDLVVPRMFSPAFRAAHPAQAREVVVEMLGAGTPAQTTSELRAVAALPDLLPRIRHFRVPIQIITGELDEATPIAYSRELAAALPHARLDILPGVGHSVHVEVPKTVLELTRRCLAEAFPA
jgi:3-oxoadipate enol-lactonase